MSVPTNLNASVQPSSPAIAMNTPPAASNYSPAVPISVYRDLAAELQTAQTQIKTLEAENRLLRNRYRQMQVEVGRVIQATNKLQPFTLESQSAAVTPQLEVVSQPAVTTEKTTPPTANPFIPQREPLFTETAIEQTSESGLTRPTEEIKGWWLFLTVILIVVTAFGTGFLVVRPFLNNSNTNAR